MLPATPSPLTVILVLHKAHFCSSLSACNEQFIDAIISLKANAFWVDNSLHLLCRFGFYMCCMLHIFVAYYKLCRELILSIYQNQHYSEILIFQVDPAYYITLIYIYVLTANYRPLNCYRNFNRIEPAHIPVRIVTSVVLYN